MSIVQRISKASNRRVYKSTVLVDPSIPLSTRQLLMSQLPILKDTADLSHEAIQLFIEMHPPIVYESADKQYNAIGNIRSVEMASLLPKNTKIYVRIIAEPRIKEIETLCLKMELLNSICLGLDTKAAPGTCLKIWEKLSFISPQSMASISPTFRRKGKFFKALGLNRRISSRLKRRATDSDIK